MGISLVLGFVELFRQLTVLIVSYLKYAFYFTSSYIQFNSVSSKHVYSLENLSKLKPFVCILAFTPSQLVEIRRRRPLETTRLTLILNIEL